MSNARALRRRSTDAERALWAILRNRQLSGFKFRRQHSIGPFVADFACVDAALAVEVDGGQHATALQSDSRRSAILAARGFTVIRFWNNEVLDNIDGVREAILRHLTNQP